MQKHIPIILRALIILIIFGTIYGSVQQSQRSGANTFPIMNAEALATQLNNGDNPQIVAGNKAQAGTIDIASGTMPFVVVYDKSGKAIAGDGYLKNKYPEIPFGVLKASEGKDYNAITWQPESGLRFAAVAVKARNYYVVSAQSLKEVEKNEKVTMKIVILGCLFALIVLKVERLLKTRISR